MTDGAGSSTSPTNASPTQQREIGRGLILAVAIIAIAAIIGVAVAVLGGANAQAQVTLRPLGSPGDDPFGPSIAPAPSASLSDFAENGPAFDRGVTEPGAANLSDYRTVRGDVPGVFGGTLNERTCDTDQLVRFLQSDQEKAQAWSSVVAVDVADLQAYADGLTAANLAADTRVLSHGFADGQLVPRCLLYTSPSPRD